MSAYDTFTAAADAAYSLACECQDEASEATTDKRRDYLLSEAARHMERCEWYEARAAMFMRMEEKRNAA